MSHSRFLLTNVDVITAGVRSNKQAIIVESGIVAEILDGDEPLSDSFDETIDLSGCIVLPGLIDLQIYGAGGLLFGGDPTMEALKSMESELCKQGVTGFLATIATNTNEVVNQGIVTAQAMRTRENSVGNFWGLHLEGPYLNPARRGAHPAHLIRASTISEVAELIAEARGCISMMTIAPELVPMEVADLLRASGVLLSAGHSNATYAEGKAFLNQPQPIRTVTHLFNAMPALHHRDLGFTLAVLEDRPFASIVVDGIHVAYPMVRLAKQLLKEKLFLITDAVTSCSTGIYPHIMHNGDRYVMPDGTLSGSALTLLKAIRNCVDHCDIPLEEAVNMATLYPAQVLGVAHQRGCIVPGGVADLCVVSADLRRVLLTVVAGRIVHRAASLRISTSISTGTS